MDINNDPQKGEEMKATVTPMEDSGSPKPETGIMDIPDEILENIFARISPYDDLDNIRLVCSRFYCVSKKVTSSLKSNFEQSVVDGNLQCEVISAPIPEQGQRTIQGSWITDRFGHMCCYHDKALYIVGGTTSTPTTFNDMWKFDLSERVWSRCLASGQYPTPKALASIVKYNDNLVLFGGWAHPPPYPLMQPWRIFDELHIYNFSTNKWSSIVTSNSPPPSAGHSASVHNDKMVVFGGRTFDKREQSFPISNTTWLFDFLTNEWYQVITKGAVPPARYGQTQIALDEYNLLVIGGCGGPNQIFSDVWLLNFSEKCFGNFSGHWEKVAVAGDEGSVPNDFHYSGCKIGTNVCFFERSSPISPFLAFLHFESLASVPPEQNELTFETRSRSYFHSGCSAGLRRQSYTTMPLYSMDISKVLSNKSVTWTKEPQPLKFGRPNERLLYTMVTGRAEIILFGGFFKQPNRRECQVSNDVFILKTVHRSY